MQRSLLMCINFFSVFVGEEYDEAMQQVRQEKAAALGSAEGEGERGSAEKERGAVVDRGTAFSIGVMTKSLGGLSTLPEHSDRPANEKAV